MTKKEILAEMFLDYFNNFLTIEGFASNYRISSELAIELLKEGKRIVNCKV